MKLNGCDELSLCNIMNRVVAAVLCINCAEMVPVDNIADHSRLCTRVSKEVRMADAAGDLLISIQLRTNKLNSYLQQVAEAAEALQSRDKSYILTIRKLLTQLTSAESPETVQQVFKSVNSLIAVFSDTFVQLDPWLMFAERVKHLAQEQESTMKLQALKSKLDEVHALQRECEQRKLKSQMWLRVLKRSQPYSSSLDSISSRLNSHNSPFESGLTSPADVEFDATPFPGIFSSEDSTHLKRHFFALGIAAKLGLPSRHFGHSTSLPKLYTKAVSLEVPVECWSEFISAELTGTNHWTAQNSSESSDPRINPIAEENEERRSTEGDVMT